MSSPDSEDPAVSGPGGRGSSGEDGHPRRAELPADVDAEFAAIIASWAADDAPHWPGADAAGGSRDPGDDTDAERASGVGLATPPEGGPRVDPPTAPAPPPGPRVDPPRSAPDDAPPARSAPSAGPRDHTPPPDPEDEHYVPPDPPPLPRLGASSVVGLLLLVVGVVLLAVPGLLGGALGVGIVPGLLAMTAGLGWLVFGLRRPADDGQGPDERGEV